MMQIRSNDFIMNMSFRFTMARELFAGLYYRTQMRSCPYKTGVSS